MQKSFYKRIFGEHIGDCFINCCFLPFSILLYFLLASPLLIFARAFLSWWNVYFCLHLIINHYQLQRSLSYILVAIWKGIACLEPKCQRCWGYKSFAYLILTQGRRETMTFNEPVFQGWTDNIYGRTGQFRTQLNSSMIVGFLTASVLAYVEWKQHFTTSKSSAFAWEPIASFFYI